MKIQLYLDRINREMIDIGPGLKAGCDIYVSWSKACCILDFKRVRREPGEENGFMLRKEDQGGLLWDPRTGAVYQLDDEAYHAILELEDGVRPKIAARRVGVTLREMNGLVAKLRELGLYA